MRVTLQSLSSTIQSQLSELTARQAQQQTRIATGQRLLQLSDAPTDIADIVSYRSMIARMQRYSSTLDQALAEQNTAEGALESISSTLSAIQTLGVDALQIANQDKWRTLASTAIEHRSDHRSANATHGDIYVFAGTKNTASVLVPTPPETTQRPFELVTTTPTASNPSGLEVRFKGNTEPRTVQTGDASAEQVSTTADKIFGAGGTALFDTLIALYNTLAYNSDGTPRADGQIPSPDQLEKVSSLVKQIADASATVNATTAELGIRTNRMTSLQSPAPGGYHPPT